MRQKNVSSNSFVEIEADSETEGARNHLDTHVAELRVLEDDNARVLNIRELEIKEEKTAKSRSTLLRHRTTFSRRDNTQGSTAAAVILVVGNPAAGFVILSHKHRWTT